MPCFMSRDSFRDGEDIQVTFFRSLDSFRDCASNFKEQWRHQKDTKLKGKSPMSEQPLHRAVITDTSNA